MKYTDIGAGSVYQTSDGRWRAAFTVGYDGRGRQVRKTVSARTEAEVIQKRNTLVQELLSGSTAPDKMTVETWVEKWLKDIAFHRLHPLVLADHRSKCRRYIIPEIGKYKLQDVGAEEVREVHAAARRAGVSERTVQIVHTVLSTCLRDAMREGIIDMNPADRVERPRAQPRVRPALSVLDARRVLMRSAEAGDPLTSFWAAALMLGARRGELIGLEWSRVDLDSGTVDLSWQIQTLPWGHGVGCRCGDGPAHKCPRRRHDAPPSFEVRDCAGSRVWTRPKTSSSIRLLPMPGVLLETFRAHREVAVENPRGLVWATPAGLPLGLKQVTAAWREALDRAEAPAVDFHSARHTTASLLLQAGVSPEVIAQMLGHSSIAATRGYMHVSRGMAEGAMRAMGELLG